ncbi:uncharacterized protein [Apostichopus japonicus]|uniref:uncharacterized protein isoform X3 n=1 Tax=Stichopus japonicus TaxID=307972 RepID=UPI003AB2CD21
MNQIILSLLSAYIVKLSFAENKTFKVDSSLWDTVHLNNCCNESVGKHIWKFNDKVIFVNKFSFVPDVLENGILLSDNFDLTLRLLNFSFEGRYACACQEINWTEYELKIKVAPVVSMTINGNNGSLAIVEAGKNFTAICKAEHAKPEVDLTWTINGNTESGSKTYTNESEKMALTFDTTSILTTTLSRGFGTVSCTSSAQGSSGEQIVNMAYQSYEKPAIFLTIAGIRTENTTYVKEGNDVDAMCHTVDGFPKFVQTLHINGEFDTADAITSYTSGHMSYNASSSLRFTSTIFDGHVTCRSSLNGTGILTEYRVVYSIYVEPVVELTLNRVDVSKTEEQIVVSKNSALNTTCSAYGARPLVEILLLVNNETVDTGGNKENDVETKEPKPDGTFDVKRQILFNYTGRIGNVTCIIISEVTGSKSVSGYFRIKDAEVPDGWTGAGPNITLYLSVAIVIILLLFAAYCIKMRLASRSGHIYSDYIAPRQQTSTFSRKLSTTSRTDSNASGSGTSQKPDKGNRISEAKEGTVKFEAIIESHVSAERLHPPQLELPKVPSDANSSEYHKVPENENVYYSTVKERATVERLFYEDDMCMIYNMKMGRLYNRWMGTITLSNNGNKCVVISTVSDSVLKKKEIHWEVFVKRALDLPAAENLTKVEGICIDSVHLYLLHEHLICSTLDSRVNTKGQSAGSSAQPPQISAMDVIRYILGILEGVKVIHSYGFLHPGLTTKKILLTKQGICKLYDFCLVEDTTRAIEAKQITTTNTLNHFAPETWMRNEYSVESDIWASAVVIWEILSHGVPPFSDDNTISKGEQPVLDLPKTWPEMYQDLKNDSLRECWALEASARPTINQLRRSFIETADILRSPISSRVSTCTLTDLYIPMKEASSTKKTAESGD